MAQRIIGIDMGPASIGAVALEGGLRGYEVVSCARVAIDPLPSPPASPEERGEGEGKEAAAPAESGGAPAEDDGLARAFTELVEKIGVARSDVVAVSLSGDQAATPIVTLPFAESKKIDATLGFEVENLLPFDLEEAIFDYQVLSQKPGQTELLVGVARGDEVGSLLARLQANGIDPRVVTLPALATFSLLSDLLAREKAPADAVEGLLDIGPDRTLLAIGRGASSERGHPALVFSRSMGGADPEALQLAIREVRQSLFSAQARTRLPLRRLRVAGEFAALDGLCERLERELGVPVERLEKLPGDAQGRIPPELQGPLAHAFGLALRGMARGRSVNLRKGPFAFKGDLDFLKGKVGRLVAFAAVLVLLVAGNVWMRTNTLRAEEEALDRALCEQTQKVLGTCETDFNLALSKLQGGDTKASQIPTASALEVFGVVTDVLPGIELRMDEIDATLERLRVRGTVDSFDAVDQVVAAMKKSRCVGDVRPGRVQKNRDEKIEFTLDALYVCGQGAQG